MVKLVNFRNGQGIPAQTFSICFLKFDFFGVNPPGNFRDLLGDHFARVESSGDQNLTMFILHFHVFPLCDLQKVMKIQDFVSPFKPLPPGTMPR